MTQTSLTTLSKFTFPTTKETTTTRIPSTTSLLKTILTNPATSKLPSRTSTVSKIQNTSKVFVSTSTKLSYPLKIFTSTSSPLTSNSKGRKINKTPKDYEEVSGMVETEDDMELDDELLKKSPESEKLTKAPGNVSMLIKAIVVGILIVSLIVVFSSIGIKQYKKSTNPLNYKNQQESSSKKVNEEFSEIRFLTSDETLDFSLASEGIVSEL